MFKYFRIVRIFHLRRYLAFGKTLTGTHQTHSTSCVRLPVLGFTKFNCEIVVTILMDVSFLSCISTIVGIAVACCAAATAGHNL